MPVTVTSGCLKVTGEKNNAGKEVLEAWRQRITAWQDSLRTEGNCLQQDAQTLEQIQRFLENAEGMKINLKKASDQAADAVASAKEALRRHALPCSLWNYHKIIRQRTRPRQQWKKPGIDKEKKEQSYSAARSEEQKAKSAEDNARTLITRYLSELPGQREEKSCRETEYRQIMTEKDLTEAEWKELTERHDRGETEILQKKADSHSQKKAAAERMKHTAETAIRGRQRPELGKLEQAKAGAEEKMASAQEAFEETKEYYKANMDVYLALRPVMEERGRIMEEHRRLDDLYNLLAGNVSGSRMDIETFVQRHYLERILHAANRRFQEMSAGQFELRMCDLDRAGIGKNRGLDLMVYSTVTGKEREVRTLSGGESFMAALALALGMADQIQESAASVNLDVMFIDEGFGSLDEHSRDKAVRVLQDMAGGSKMIGIISHVTELKQEIEDQLIVRKDEEGSHVRWQIS